VELLPGHDAGDSARRRQVEAEQKRLRIWAREHGRLKHDLPEPDARGGEHAVWFDEPTQRILRATHPTTRLGYGLAYGSYIQGATPAEYLDRWALHNHIFGDDVRLERVVVQTPDVIVITSQPFVRGRDAGDEEILEFMTGFGFERIGPGAFYHADAGLLVDDLFPRNAKVSARGVVLPIDGVFQRITPDFARFLHEEFFPGIPPEPARPPAGPLPPARPAERPARQSTGVPLELDPGTRARWADARGCELLRERANQPRLSRREALLQIAETLTLSEMAQVELRSTAPTN